VAWRQQERIGIQGPGMFKDKRVVVVMPAYNAEKTLQQTVTEIRAQDVVDRMILVDDGSHDRTAEVAAALGDVEVHRHARNLGYGGNQKTCYRLALASGADIVIMVHPDYQYSPRLIPALACLVGNGLYPLVLGSRILGGHALRGGMPIWKYIANRCLTGFQNFLCGAKLSEYHTGYRAYSRELLERLNFDACSNDFVFDNQVIAQVLALDEPIGEIACPTRYFPEASSINFGRSVRYGLGCAGVAVAYRLSRWFPVLTPRYLRFDR
jgi:glycosyltransferase involved in cell wall biosynthesis